MLKDIKAVILHPATLIVWVVLSVWLTFSGPFGTYEGASLSQRMLYWPIVAGLGVGAGVTLRMYIRRRFPQLNYWQCSALSSTGLAALLALPAYKLTAAMLGGEALSNPMPGHVESGLAIFAVAMGMNALRYALSPRRAVNPRDEMPPLLDRLEPGNRAPVIRLSSSNHYVNVVTELGEQEVLIRLADAIAELNGVKGLQVHRSHWVATAAVIGHERDKGRLFLLTSDGAKVPVSRSFRPEVEAQGLLKGA